MGMTNIEWTSTLMPDGTSIPGYSFNPWWGCVRVSPACEHCYAETWAKRFGVEWGVKAERRPASEKVWASPLRWNKAAQKAGVRARVFCASMADVFEDRRDLDVHRQRLFDIIAITPWLDWQLLTKRPEAVMRLVPEAWNFYGWPKNVWIGTTVEDQRRADERIPHLLAIPAVVRFLSCEPLLGLVDLSPWMDRMKRLSYRQIGLAPLGAFCHHVGCPEEAPCPEHQGINWVIGGGESGNGARPPHPAWARSLRDQCAAAGVPFFWKQWGEWAPCSHNDGNHPVVAIRPDGTSGDHYEDARMIRVGKKAAGALLDGLEHKAFPVVQP